MPCHLSIALSQFERDDSRGSSCQITENSFTSLCTLARDGMISYFDGTTELDPRARSMTSQHPGRSSGMGRDLMVFQRLLVHSSKRGRHRNHRVARPSRVRSVRFHHPAARTTHRSAFAQVARKLMARQHHWEPDRAPGVLLVRQTSCPPISSYSGQ